MHSPAVRLGAPALDPDSQKSEFLTVFLFLAHYGRVFTVKPGQGIMRNNPKIASTHPTTMPLDWA